jgi:hypothetical protein
MTSRYYVLIQPQTSAEKCRYRRAHQKQASNMSVCSKPTCFFGTFPDSQSELFLTLMDACLPICLFVSKRPKLTLRTLLKGVNACLAMYIMEFTLAWLAVVLPHQVPADTVRDCSANASANGFSECQQASSCGWDSALQRAGTRLTQQPTEVAGDRSRGSSFPLE